MPRVINVDGHPAYASAIAELKQTGELGPRCLCRTAPYLNNIIEQDHRFIKKRITASLGFRSASYAEGSTFRASIYLNRRIACELAELRDVQLSVGFLWRRSTTITSTGTLRDSSLRPTF